MKSWRSGRCLDTNYVAKSRPGGVDLLDSIGRGWALINCILFPPPSAPYNPQYPPPPPPSSKSRRTRPRTRTRLWPSTISGCTVNWTTRMWANTSRRSSSELSCLSILCLPSSSSSSSIGILQWLCLPSFLWNHKSRSLNHDWCRAFLCLPIFQSKGFVVEALQGGHSAHHRNAESLRDRCGEAVPWFGQGQGDHAENWTGRRCAGWHGKSPKGWGCEGIQLNRNWWSTVFSYSCSQPKWPSRFCCSARARDSWRLSWCPEWIVTGRSLPAQVDRRARDPMATARMLSARDACPVACPWRTMTSPTFAAWASRRTSNCRRLWPRSKEAEEEEVHLR